MKKIAVYPGTFDPVTKGHEALVIRALPLFDEIIVAIGHNAQKAHYFSLEKRIEWLTTVFKPYPSVRVDQFEGLTVDYCLQQEARFILRGLRSNMDFDFEKNIAHANSSLHPEIETIFLVSYPALSTVNSSIVRDIHRHGGKISQFIPDSIIIDAEVR